MLKSAPSNLTELERGRSEVKVLKRSTALRVRILMQCTYFCFFFIHLKSCDSFFFFAFHYGE